MNIRQQFVRVVEIRRDKVHTDQQHGCVEEIDLRG